MADEKPGLLKRIFSFGFGRKAAEPAPATEVTRGQVPESVREPQSEVVAVPEPLPDADVPESPIADEVDAGEISPAAISNEAAGIKNKAVQTVSETIISPPKRDKPAKPAKEQKPEQRAKPAVEDKAEPVPAHAEKASTPRQARTGTVTILDGRKAAVPQAAQEKSGWLARLRSGLSRSANALTGGIASALTGRKLDDVTLEDIEDILVRADLGVETAGKITARLSEAKFGSEITERDVRNAMATEIEAVLAPVAIPLQLDLAHRPHVILVVGVNGSGKTTTIGKMAAKLRDAGLSTLLVAGDTFRAAAIEQLKIWGERMQSPVIAREIGADAAGLAFDAWKQARDGDHDVMLMDTAGRLQNRVELMAELEKIVRVLKKHDPAAPHTVILTLDATTGQNAMNQVEIFAKTAGVNGLAMTKLDGTARGGILVAIAARHKLPVFFLGVGEKVEDLEPFEAQDFARSLAGLESA